MFSIRAHRCGSRCIFAVVTGDDDAEPWIEILGPVRVTTPGQPLEVLPGQLGRILCRLALTPGKPVDANLLIKNVWDTEEGSLQGLQTAVTKLRRFGLTIKGNQGSYTLDVGTDAVDAHVFVAATESLADGFDTDRVANLLRMWRADPRSTHGAPWPLRLGPFLRARDKLIGHIEAQPDEVIAGLEPLLDFMEMHAGDPGVERIRQRLTVPVPRKRLLIVEDQIGADIKETLGDYDCVLVESLTDFWVEVDRGPLQFDGALVDRHLERDDDGLTVCLHLRSETEFPVMLMTVDPPVGALDIAKQKYGVRNIFNKGQQISLAELRDTVARLLEDA